MRSANVLLLPTRGGDSGLKGGGRARSGTVRPSAARPAPTVRARRVASALGARGTRDPRPTCRTLRRSTLLAAVSPLST